MVSRQPHRAFTERTNIKEETVGDCFREAQVKDATFAVHPNVLFRQKLLTYWPTVRVLDVKSVR
jgi:hypothetical protein